MTDETALKAPWRIGVDIGGTFTDLVLIDSAGLIWQYKSPSEPKDPSAGVLMAINGAAAELGLDVNTLLRNCTQFIHGSTIATNILLERKGAKVGLLTTDGFRDTLEIRRGFRDDMWNHRQAWTDVLVPRRLRLPVIERTGADGTIVKPVDEQSVIKALDVFESRGVNAIAVCFLNSYINQHNEHQVKALIETRCDVPVSCSSDIAPILGEYERCSTVVANAYVLPKVWPYLKSLSNQLRDMGLPQDIFLIQSSGGAISLATVGSVPAALALSGPAAGVGSMQYFSQQLAEPNLITIEIGGTSCDVTAVHNGKVAETDSLRINETLIALPSLDIHTISTGGGTIAGVDDGGMLYAGPAGAGAKPGPACYGLGGDEPTVTDAQVLLGRLKPGLYAGGLIQLDKAMAEAAVKEKLADPLTLDTAAAAVGVIRLVDQHIRHAIERVSLERGLDPRQFTLVGAGGAGALHVAAVARSLGCSRAFVPRLAGVFCAFGMCNSKVRHDFVHAMSGQMDEELVARIASVLKDMRRSATAQLSDEGFANADIECRIYLDLKYPGQLWTIRVPVDASDVTCAAIRQVFESEYERQFASIQPDGTIEVVNVCLSAFGSFPSTPVIEQDVVTTSPAPSSKRRVYVGEGAGFQDIAVYDGGALLAGQNVPGPALIEEQTTTVLIGESDTLAVDSFGNYQIDLPGGDARASH